MSREIKFRAWNEESECYTCSQNITEQVFANAVVHPEGTGQFVLDNGVDYLFEQWTGLFDKNGVEIYEGDIVRHENPKCKGDVMMGEYESGEYDTHVSGNGFYINRELDYCGQQHFEPLGSNMGVEIIGDIHRHPELLE